MPYHNGVCSFKIHLLCRICRQGVPKPISSEIGVPGVGKVKNHYCSSYVIVLDSFHTQMLVNLGQTIAVMEN